VCLEKYADRRMYVWSGVIRQNWGFLWSTQMTVGRKAQAVLLDHRTGSWWLMCLYHMTVQLSAQQSCTEPFKLSFRELWAPLAGSRGYVGMWTSLVVSTRGVGMWKSLLTSTRGCVGVWKSLLASARGCVGMWTSCKYKRCRHVKIFTYKYKRLCRHVKIFTCKCKRLCRHVNIFTCK
jgi:hypothetical protein